LDFGDRVTLSTSPGRAMALLDQLLHHVYVINLRGDSCRVRNRLVPPRNAQAKEGYDNAENLVGVQKYEF